MVLTKEPRLGVEEVPRFRGEERPSPGNVNQGEWLARKDSLPNESQETVRKSTVCKIL
jgi:hypothetical protein